MGSTPIRRVGCHKVQCGPCAMGDPNPAVVALDKVQFVPRIGRCERLEIVAGTCATDHQDRAVVAAGFRSRWSDALATIVRQKS